MTYDEQPFRPLGVNLGGWLNLEAYMIGLEGTDWQIRTAMRSQLGEAEAAAFFGAYEKAFVNETDIREIAHLGFNTVRIPLNWRRFEDEAAPFVYHESGFAPVEALFDWCGRHGLAVLLDLHAAPGGQNTTPPADNPTGYAQLWQSRHAQDRVIAWWKEMARRFHNHPALLGYNLLNEPQVNQHGEMEIGEQAAAMNRLYAECIEAIRTIDAAGWIVLSPPVRTSGGCRHLDPDLFEDVHTALSYHHYPLASYERGINFEADRSGEDSPEAWYAFLEEQTGEEAAYAEKIRRPVLLGEFGWPQGADPGRAAASMQAQLQLHKDRGWGWLLWAWKDLRKLGLYQPTPEQEWTRFVNDPAWRARRSRCREAFAAHFDNTYIAELGKDERNALVYDAAWGDGQRGLNRILLERQLRALVGASPEAMATMAEAFLLQNCRNRREVLSLVEAFLPSR
jgi:hypothetical protein